MNEEEAKAWVKDKKNQKTVVEQFFIDYPPTKQKLAFFMAGIPGAGKTEFAQNTINALSPKLVPIEHDKLVEYIKGYESKDYYHFRKAGSILVTRILDECIKNGYSFILDGTLSSPAAAGNIARTLAGGYYIFVVYIIQDTKNAWLLTKDRELVTKRAIEKSGFIETCSKINANLLTIFKRFKLEKGFSFWILNKTGQSSTGKATSVIYNSGEIGSAEDIETILQKDYNIEELS